MTPTKKSIQWGFDGSGLYSNFLTKHEQKNRSTGYYPKLIHNTDEKQLQEESVKLRKEKDEGVGQKAARDKIYRLNKQHIDDVRQFFDVPGHDYDFRERDLEAELYFFVATCFHYSSFLVLNLISPM